MKKQFLRALAVICGLSLMVVTSLNAYATEDTTTSETTSSDTSDSESSDSSDDEEKAQAKAAAQEALEAAQKEKEELESALAAAEALVDELQSSKSSTESKIASLNSQLNTISANIEVLEGQLDDLESQIELANAELEYAQALSEQQYEAMKLRIKYIYENGNTNYINLIFASKDFSSLLNAIEYVSMLSSYDRTMLQEYEDNIAYQEEVKAELEAEYATAEATRESIGLQKQTVQVLKDAKTTELAEIGEDLEDAEETAEMYEQEVKAQAEILATIQAQIAAMDYSETYISSGIFCWPCPDYKYVSSDYGPRTAPTSGASTNHKGIDLAAPYGSAILAAESGVVTTASYSSSGGNYIIINHGTDSSGNVICTVYMHCSALYVSEGDVVGRGQTIAAVGSTGVSTGNHLHFAVTLNGSYTSPWNYVSEP